MTARVNLEKRLRWAGMLVVAGLLVEGICLLSARSTAFIVLVVVGGFLCAAGIVVYLYSLLPAGGTTHER